MYLRLATGAGEMFSTTGTVAAQTSGAGEVYSMAETGADDTVGAEDDFGLIQEVSSLCPPLSPVPDCTILGIFGRIQEVSNCCPLSLQLALQIVEHMLKFANVAPAGAWPNFSLAPLDFMALMMRHKMG